jgi:hypothetical protein
MEITIKITAHEETYSARVVSADVMLGEFRGAEGLGVTVVDAIQKMARNAVRYESPSFWDAKLVKWNKSVADWTKVKSTAVGGFSTL